MSRQLPAVLTRGPRSMQLLLSDAGGTQPAALSFAASLEESRILLRLAHILGRRLTDPPLRSIETGWILGLGAFNCRYLPPCFTYFNVLQCRDRAAPLAYIQHSVYLIKFNGFVGMKMLYDE